MEDSSLVKRSVDRTLERALLDSSSSLAVEVDLPEALLLGSLLIVFALDFGLSLLISLGLSRIPVVKRIVRG